MSRPPIEPQTRTVPRSLPLAAAILALLAGPGASAMAAHARPHAAAATASGPALASAQATAVVTNCNDAGPGSLRQAYAAAVDGSVIDMSQLGCSTITLTTGALTNAAGAATSGPGGITVLGNYQTIDAKQSGRVVVHNGSDELVLARVKLRNGDYAGTRGGCVYAYGSVTLQHSEVSFCTLHPANDLPARGGAVYARKAFSAFGGSLVAASTATARNYGSAEGGGVWAHDVLIDRSTVRGNSAVGALTAARGGGVFAADFGASDRRLLLRYATLDGNYSVVGGGAYVYGAVDSGYSTISGNVASGNGGGLAIAVKPAANVSSYFASSTISGNVAVLDGGGVHIDAPAPFKNCTVTDNIATHAGGGLFLRRGNALVNSIVALNIAEGVRSSDDIGGSGATISGHNNLVIASTVALPGDTLIAGPGLGPLQDNGGYNLTHALLTGSPAIDHGSSLDTPFSYDQRGVFFPRTVGANVDIGAIELQDLVFRNGFEQAAFAP